MVKDLLASRQKILKYNDCRMQGILQSWACWCIPVSYNSSTQGKGSGVEGYALLHSEFAARLSYMKPHLLKKKVKIKIKK